MRSVAVEARDGRVRVGREGAIDESARVGVRFLRRRLGRDDGGRVGTAFLFFELHRWYRCQPRGRRSSDVFLDSHRRTIRISIDESRVRRSLHSRSRGGGVSGCARRLPSLSSPRRSSPSRATRRGIGLWATPVSARGRRATRATRVPSRSRTDRFGAPASLPGPDGKTHCARCLGCNVVLSPPHPRRRLPRPRQRHRQAQRRSFRRGRLPRRDPRPRRGVRQDALRRPGRIQAARESGTHRRRARTRTRPSRVPIPPARARPRTMRDGASHRDRSRRSRRQLIRVSPSSWTTTLRTFLPPRRPRRRRRRGNSTTSPRRCSNPRAGTRVGTPRRRTRSRRTRVVADATRRRRLRARRRDVGLSPRRDDRHFENVYLDVDADPPRVTLIDNDGAMRPRDGISSVFLPGTRWWHVHRRGEGGGEMCCRGDPRRTTTRSSAGYRG